ncbi:unnamed protein product [Tilletia laevis]|uniref:Uncharacterized protein n=1 Tax=Tilletia laevis TaxID=157183 RepID=A0A9N8L860_9BASI|nr:unnamed protein product [Tilletia laevis]CAD6949922.1 unnamed protein product [Tilletia laevis]
MVSLSFDSRIVAPDAAAAAAAASRIGDERRTSVGWRAPICLADHRHIGSGANMDGSPRATAHGNVWATRLLFWVRRVHSSWICANVGQEHQMGQIREEDAAHPDDSGQRHDSIPHSGRGTKRRAGA